MQYEVEVNGRACQVTVHRADDRFVVTLDGRDFVVDAARLDKTSLSLLIGHSSFEVSLAQEPGSEPLSVMVGGTRLTASVNNRRRWGRKDDSARTTGGPQRLLAPMPGKVVRVPVRAGDQVRARQPLAVIEAMKMENELRATRAGLVSEIHVQEGQSVDAGALLLVVVPA